MGKVSDFELILEDKKSVYCPGEMVVGKCLIFLKDEVKLRNIRVSMRGVASVSWTEPGEDNSFQIRQSTLNLCNENQLLCGSENKKADLLVLKQGRYEFPFCFNLPQGMPASFKGAYGCISYWLEAKMDKPWTFKNKKTTEAFAVVSVIDINQPEFQRQIQNSAEKTICCCCCRSGIISLNAKTDRKGYCLGESISIWMELNNQSKRKITPSATLYQVQTLTVDNNKTKKIVKKRSRVIGINIGSYSNSTRDGLMVKIPEDFPPTILNCSNIEIIYYVKVVLHIPGSSNLSVRLPVIIGTIPFRGNDIHPPQLIQPTTSSPPPYQLPNPLSSTYVPEYGGVVNAGFMHTPSITNDYNSNRPPAYY